MSSPQKSLQDRSELSPDNVITLQTHILSEERRHPDATGTFSWILSALAISAKIIAAKIRRARLENVLGSIGELNVQGEQQEKLDVISNDVLLRCLGSRSGVAIVASEEDHEPTILRTENDGERRYCVLFDPLDGSSNLDVAGGVGTIFSILRHDRRTEHPEDSILQPGREQVAAGKDYIPQIHVAPKWSRMLGGLADYFIIRRA